MGNAELGIGIQDAIAADARMQGKDGLAAQQAWGSHYLGERVMGAAIALMAVATPMVLRQGGTQIGSIWIAILLFIGICFVSIRRGRADTLDAIRKRQLEEHRANPTVQAIKNDATGATRN